MKGAQEPDLIDFEGFGLDLADEEDNGGDIHGELDSNERHHGQNKKTDKLMKEFAKLVLGTDANIIMDPRKSRHANQTTA